MNTSKILLLGKGGQLSNALSALLRENAIIVGADEANFLDADFTTRLEQCIGNRGVSAVINTAAYTQVDKAEGEDRDRAFRINGTAVGELAVWCKQKQLPLVHYSSDYVFGGSGNTPHRETDKPAPLSAYGDSKLAGERALMDKGDDFLVFRTSWLYDADGKNFFNTMRRLMHEKESLNIVSDQIGAPTYVPHLAKATLDILEQALGKPAFPSGLYHLCSAGETSWHGFAKAIFEHLRAVEPNLRCQSVNPIPSSAYPLPARRPLNSRLDCMRVRETFGITMPSWEKGLEECFEYCMAPLAD